MAKEITEDDLDLLDELGVEAEPVASGGRTPREQRIIAGFEEIQRFCTDRGKVPEHGVQRDIFERLYALRLDRIRASAECREALKDLDTDGLLGAEAAASCILQEQPEQTDDELLASLGVGSANTDDLTRLTHVRARDEIKAAEEIAQRNPCNDFDMFKPLFEKVQEDMAVGHRQTLKYKDNADVKRGDLFILDGQKLVVADMGESFVSDYGRQDRRLRVVYDNGTESDLLVRSLQRALNKDKASRRITEPGFGPLFSDEESDDDLPTGYIYVLRSKSENAFVAANRTVLHKIGVTGGDVKRRLANAKKDPTFLLADAEIVATFKLANINRTKLEAVLHRFFGSARLDLELKDRFGEPVELREWFLVPLPVIEQAIEMLRAGSIGNFRYDPTLARVVKR